MSNIINDNGNDRKYFMIVPRLVLAKTTNPFQLSLWCTIRDIAGEHGECYLSTNDLATLSMMSVGKVSEERLALIELGLITGETRKDPGYPQPVWHLNIPDIWEENLLWSKKHNSLKERIEIKSFHHMKPSPHEKGYTPHETKKIEKKIKKTHKEEEKDMEFDQELIPYLKARQLSTTEPSPSDLRIASTMRTMRKSALRHEDAKLSGLPSDVYDHLIVFVDEFGRSFLKSEKADWIKDARKWTRLGATPEDVKLMFRHCRSQGTAIKRPGSITWAWDELRNTKKDNATEQFAKTY